MSLQLIALQVILQLGPQVRGGAVARPPPRPRPAFNSQHHARLVGRPTVVQNSRLLRLPPELRNRIYEMVLLDTVQDFRFAFYHYPSYPRILQVCQQIRLEALCVYFRHAEFEFVIHWSGLGALLHYLNALDAQARVQLLKNKNLCVHIIYDQYHPRYREVKTWLGRFSYAYQHDGPYLTAEDYPHERAPTDKMRSKKKRKEVRALRHAAELKEVAEKGADAVKLQKQAAKAVKHQDLGRALLHKELGVAYDRITSILKPPPEDDSF